MLRNWKASATSIASQCSLSNKNSIVVESGIPVANGFGSPLSSTMSIMYVPGAIFKSGFGSL